MKLRKRRKILLTGYLCDYTHIYIHFFLFLFIFIMNNVYINSISKQKYILITLILAAASFSVVGVGEFDPHPNECRFIVLVTLPDSLGMSNNSHISIRSFCNSFYSVLILGRLASCFLLLRESFLIYT